MTERVRSMLDFYRDRGYRALRRAPQTDLLEKTANVSAAERERIVLAAVLAEETPHFFPGDLFGFHRALAAPPPYCNEKPLFNIFNPGNLVPDYGFFLQNGIDGVLALLRERLGEKTEKDAFFSQLIEELKLILAYCEKERQGAEEAGLTELAEALKTVPAKPPESFYQALLFQAILIFALRYCPNYSHLTLGRFDRYMLPFFDMDLKSGVSEDALFEQLELYFIHLNFDTDLYYGMQQGDDGQSMVLGGYGENGEDQYTRLSELCIKASLELSLIDPKINLRVSKDTPLERFIEGTRLTRIGLGFPQYLNDDVIVPGLVALGYDPADARDFAVAACWEVITSGKGAELPNRTSLNYPLVVGEAIRTNLLTSETFDDLLPAVRQAVEAEAERIFQRFNGNYTKPCPLLSLFVDGCLREGRDLSEGWAKYRNFGMHAPGLSSAANQLAAVKALIYDEKRLTKEELLAALADNFEGHDALRKMLLEAPKVGNDDDRADEVFLWLLDLHSKTLNGKPNGLGGIWRAGTGSAQNYRLSGEKCPATADGRKAWEPYPCSFSPALGLPVAGPVSVIKSFTKFDLTRLINGGPLTLEISDGVFRNEEGIRKTAVLVKYFVDRGGHELQLNAVNRDKLLDAQAHPENYRDLIVRVWGWSGYFTELEKPYQDHVIRRTEHVL